MNQQDTDNNPTLREDLVKTAVQFLQNPKVSLSPLGQKKEFLKRKGLTDNEVEEACRLACVDNNINTNLSHKANDTIVSLPQNQIYPYLQTYPYQTTLLFKIKEFFNITALIGTTLYSIYWFYKKFIKPALFGRKKKGNGEQSELDKAIQASMTEMKESILKVESDVQKLTQTHTTDSTIPQLVQELKQDLSSLKALLLSRKQFPSAPASIPSWQLDAAHSSQEKAPEREDDAGSGSSTNNSDSSLEMIREDPPKE